MRKWRPLISRNFSCLGVGKRRCPPLLGSTRPRHPRTDTRTPPTPESPLPPHPPQASHLDEAVKGIVCLPPELTDVCQRDLQAGVWMAGDSAALKLRLAQVLGLYAGWSGWGGGGEG